MTIATYKYFYGSGTEPNREILFLRKNDSESESIYALVRAYSSGEWKKISEVAGGQINVDMMTTSEKVNALLAERQGASPQRNPAQKLSDLSFDIQKEILGNLEPKGAWRIEVTNHFGEDPRFEKVVQLNLFNPT